MNGCAGEVSAEHNPDEMDCAIIGERNVCGSSQELAIQFREDHTASYSRGILDVNVVD